MPRSSNLVLCCTKQLSAVYSFLGNSAARLSLNHVIKLRYKQVPHVASPMGEWTRDLLRSPTSVTSPHFCKEEANQQFSLQTELGDLQCAHLQLVIG